MKTLLAAGAILVVALAPALSAHRLDEYLHASRLAVERDRIDIDIDLTPGVALADDVFRTIDVDGSGDISPAEARAYASLVVRSLVIRLDGQRLTPQLVSCRTSQLADMREGVGVLQLTATAPIARLAAGSHQLFFRNDHRPDRSVYLVNMLVPSSPAIAIGALVRDVGQHELTADFRVAPDWTSTAGLALTAAAISLPAALMWRRRRPRRLSSGKRC
jgi:hypothetical protein